MFLGTYNIVELHPEQIIVFLFWIEHTPYALRGQGHYRLDQSKIYMAKYVN